jgi:hypothetical protein
MQKECIYCGQEFTTRNPNAFCCKSIECLKDHSRLITSKQNPSDFKYKLKCQVCGEEFYTNNKKAKCCNQQCSGTFGILSPIKQYGEPQYTEAVVCKNCNSEFDVKKGQARSHKFCSHECKLEYSLNKVKNNMIGKKFNRLYILDIYRKTEKSGKIRFFAQYKCDCGNYSEASVDSITSNQATSCGCYGREVYRGQSGEDNPCWKGGITQIKDHLRSNINQWKLDSMKQCNYKCEITGKSFDEIHHLYPFNKIIDETFEITKIERKQEIKDYTQKELKQLEETCLQLHYKYPLGVCLTKEIHVLFHSIYGRKDCMPKDYYEFKEKYLNNEYSVDD